jgi:hypothetical protein
MDLKVMHFGGSRLRVIRFSGERMSIFFVQVKRREGGKVMYFGGPRLKLLRCSGERIEDMKAILERVSSVCGLLDTDGIAIHTMNNDLCSDNIRNSHEAANFVSQVGIRQRIANYRRTSISGTKKNTDNLPA